MERFRATEWIAPSELRNWLELSAILWVGSVTVRNGPEGIARRTEKTFDGARGSRIFSGQQRGRRHRRFVGSENWLRSIVGAVLTSILSYLLFDTWLQANLPKGILGF